MLQNLLHNLITSLNCVSPSHQADSMSDTSFDSDAYAEGSVGSSTEVGSIEGDEDREAIQ